MDAIVFSLLLVSAGAWLAGTALRDVGDRWVFVRELPTPPRHHDPHSPFRAGEPDSNPVWFDDRGERRALRLARVVGVTTIFVALALTRWMVDDLPGDARWVLVGWSFLIGSAMVRDQLCREWWAALVGVPAMFFAYLIDPSRWPWVLVVWLVHVGLRGWVELRRPRPRRA
ncbi:hypothetical protein ACNOYE_13725 [Nannocystaceae bacterium ST9]